MKTFVIYNILEQTLLPIKIHNCRVPIEEMTRYDA